VDYENFEIHNSSDSKKDEVVILERL